MIIDFHTHAFPEKIARKALSSLSHEVGGVIPQTDGTFSSLKREMEADGVDLAVLMAIATSPRQQTNVNNFAIEVNGDDRFLAFGSVHPDAPDALEELERLAQAGLKGVKFHPEYQQFYADDPKMKPIYRKISQLGLITLFHAGEDYGFAPPYHGMPEQILGALRWLDGPVVAAHWGGMGCAQEVLRKLCGVEGLYFDTSYGCGIMARPLLQKIVDTHGPAHILFGSDMPWHRPQWELNLLNTLDMTREERDMILWKNASGLFGL